MTFRLEMGYWISDGNSISIVDYWNSDRDSNAISMLDTL